MIAALILIAVDVYIFINTGKKKEEPVPVQDKKEESEVTWTVYGTNWCGWTKKQLEYLKKKGIPHKFIDCEKSKCDGIDAFPVMESSSGEKVTGYKEV
tara:strand:+ start:2435 stop:2728 length:294 start_codon:yes stop_codon:yes gene_type:complete